MLLLLLWFWWAIQLICAYPLISIKNNNKKSSRYVKYNNAVHEIKHTHTYIYCAKNVCNKKKYCLNCAECVISYVPTKPNMCVMSQKKAMQKITHSVSNTRHVKALLLFCYDVPPKKALFSACSASFESIFFPTICIYWLVASPFQKIS